VLNQNGLAVVEMNLGNLARARKLVTDGLARWDRELGQEAHRTQRAVLLRNRSQILRAMGESAAS
jgi:hypothetical protein